MASLAELSSIKDNNREEYDALSLKCGWAAHMWGSTSLAEATPITEKINLSNAIMDGGPEAAGKRVIDQFIANRSTESVADILNSDDTTIKTEVNKILDGSSQATIFKDSVSSP